MKILIADDHDVVRKGLVAILRESQAAAVVGEAANGTLAIDMALGDDWDALILDISMPGANGFQVLKTVRLSKPSLPVIMLSMHSGAIYVNGAIRAGASGYLSKETAAEELLPALRAALSGETYVSPSIH